VTQSGAFARQLRDSHIWQKVVAKEQKRAVSGFKQCQDLGSREDDENEENYDEEDECRSAHNGETQPNTTSGLAQSLREDAARSRPQPNPSRSDTVRQRSVQLGDGDVV
jgi:hypothetical protein